MSIKGCLFLHLLLDMQDWNTSVKIAIKTNCIAWFIAANGTNDRRTFCHANDRCNSWNFPPNSEGRDNITTLCLLVYSSWKVNKSALSSNNGDHLSNSLSIAVAAVLHPLEFTCAIPVVLYFLAIPCMSVTNTLKIFRPNFSLYISGICFYQFTV